MNFRRGRASDVPEINLIPLIDVLLVIIIFLMLTTTYAKFSGLEINLPTADASKQTETPNEINVGLQAETRTRRLHEGIVQALGSRLEETLKKLKNLPIFGKAFK